MTRRIFHRLLAVFLCLMMTSSAFASNVTVHFSEGQTVTLRREEAGIPNDNSDALFSADQDETETESESITEADSVFMEEADKETEMSAETEADDAYPEQVFHETTGKVTVFVNAST